MRKRVKVVTSLEQNDVTNVWFKHLVNRLVLEELELPTHLKAKLLYENNTTKKRGR